MTYLEYLLKDKKNLKLAAKAVASQYAIYNRKLVDYDFLQDIYKDNGTVSIEDCVADTMFLFGMEVDENGDRIEYTN